MRIEGKLASLGRVAVVMLWVAVLCGCASLGARREADRQFGDGNYVAAIESYREASELAPDDVRYRQNYLNKRDDAIAILSSRADVSLGAGDLAAAESSYQAILQLDQNNAYARGQLRALQMRRRHDEQATRIDELVRSETWDEARRLVDLVLSENPSHARALNARDRIRAHEFEQTAIGDGLDERFKTPVTLEFRDVPVRTVFQVLSEASGINFIYDQEIRPDLRVTVQLRRTPLDEAIRLIGLSTQLETMVINDNSMLLFPSTPQKISEYRQLKVRSFFLSNAQASVVADSIRTILKTESLVVDENLNMLVMRDSPEAIGLAERLVYLHDISSPEVVLEVEILEVNRTTLRDMGVNLPKEIGFSVNDTQQSSEWQSLDQLRSLNSSSIYGNVPNASIRLSDSTSDASILANPRIRVQNRETARIMIGDKVPVITSTSTSTGFVSETVNYVDVGLKLEVQPAIFASNEIAIKVNLEVSRLVREIQTPSGTLSYQIGTRNAETLLRLRDGETQILAGLINQEDRRTGTGWPWTTRFPVLNRLFGTRRTDVQDTEIVLSITPRLIRGVARADLSELQFDSGTAMRLGGGPARSVASAMVDGLSEDTTPIVGEPAAPATPVVAPIVSPVTDEPVVAEPLAAVSPQAMLGWSVPSEVRVGEQFTAALNISTMQAIEQVPVMLGFSPQILQVVGVEEGSFMTQGGGQSSLSQQVNLTEGRISAAVTRQGSAISGQGVLLNVTFRALAPSSGTELSILSAETQPDVGAVRTFNASLTVR